MKKDEEIKIKKVKIEKPMKGNALDLFGFLL